MQLNEKIGNILINKLDKYQKGELPIITTMIIGSILHNGIDYFKDMTDEKAETVLNNLKKPEKTTDGKRRIKLTTSELDADMLAIKREICSTCDIAEIENLIVYCNRGQNSENSEKDELIDSLLEMISESGKFSDEEISERTGLDPESFYELTGWRLNSEK